MQCLSLVSSFALSLVSFSGAFAQFIDQKSSDIKVLKAFDTQVSVGTNGNTLNFENCLTIKTYGDYADIDCKEEVLSVLKRNAEQVVAPFIETLVFQGAYKRTNSTGFAVSSYYCNILQAELGFTKIVKLTQ
jgi:NADH/NAD ratio-sensing transcriptional regulator Rex